MATRDELIDALTKADAAGDTASATAFASMIKGMPAAPTTAPAGPSTGMSQFRAIEHDVPGALDAAQRAPTSIPVTRPPIADMPPSPPPPMTAVGDTDMGKPIAAATPALPRTPPAAVIPLPADRSPQSMAAWRKRSIDADKQALDPTLGMDPVSKFFVGNTQQATDAVLGAKQFANKISGGLIGDKDQLAAEAAEKARLDAPLLATGAGAAGAIAGRMIPETAAMFTGMPALAAAGRGVRAVADAIPMVPKLVARAAQAATPSVLFGAGATQLNPSEDYSVGSNALIGGALGAAGEAGGRFLGHIAAPFHGIVNGTLDAARAARYAAVEKLQEAGMLPKVIAMHLLPEQTTGLTSQIARTPLVRSAIHDVEAANRAALTESQAARAGVTGDDAQQVSTAAAAMRKQLNDEGNSFRFPNGPDQPSPDVLMAPFTPRMQAAHDAVVDYANATSQTGKAAKLQNAVDATVGAPPTPSPPSVILDASGNPISVAGGAATQSARPVSYTLDELMDLRNAAGAMAHKESDAVMSGAYTNLRNTYADAIKSGLNDAGFPQHAEAVAPWLKKYGNMFDFERAGARSGAGDLLDPTATFKAVARTDAERVAPTDPNAVLLKSLSEVSPGLKNQAGAGVSSELGRTLSMMGLPATIGGVYGYAKDGSKLGGGAVGALAGLAGMKFMAHLLSSPGGARYLTGQYMGDSLTDVLNAMRRGGAVSAIEAGR